MSTAIETKRRIKLRKPPKYCNVFLNNDVTSFDFVIHILCKVFNYDIQTADQKAKEIHKNGKSVVFISSKEACEAKKQSIDLEKTKFKEIYLKHEVIIYEEE